MLAAFGFIVAPAASARDATVEAPVRRMMDAFNKGDIAAVKTAHVPSPTIVDNVPPFAWSGPDAFDHWVADLGKAEAADGTTGSTVTFAPVVDEVVSGDRAYIVTRSIYAFKRKGRRMREIGYTRFVLAKLGAEWKVASWNWASPAAVPVK